MNKILEKNSLIRLREIKNTAEFNKDSDSWNKLKKEIDSYNEAPTFQEREIWWCNIGLNIGHEENGKNDDFSRSILIIKKFNKQLFLRIPLATKIKDKPYYYKFISKKKINV